MPADVTIFAAKYLIFLDALLALCACGWLLYQRPRIDAVRWVIACVIMIVLAYAFAKIGNGLYSDPRPFATDHVKPLISHARDNGFPSDHALLAAAIVAAVLFLSPVWWLPFAVLAVLVDWARVGAGLHHVLDVVGSSVIVALAAVIAALVTPVIMQALAPRLPDSWIPRKTEVRQV
jgi:membrane-associated phospholipid phosphatase